MALGGPCPACLNVSCNCTVSAQTARDWAAAHAKAAPGATGSNESVRVYTVTPYDLAQLRHLYMNLLRLNASMANGLLAPVIRNIERTAP